MEEFVSKEDVMKLIVNMTENEDDFHRLIRGLVKLDTLPTNIIFCKDCKHASPNRKEGCIATTWSRENLYLHGNDFCAKAEKRDKK